MVAGGFVGGVIGMCGPVPLGATIGELITTWLEWGSTDPAMTFKEPGALVGGLLAWVVFVIGGAWLARAIVRQDSETRAKPPGSYDDLS